MPSALGAPTAPSSSPGPERLAENLAALAAVQPDLRRRLDGGGGGQHLRGGPAGPAMRVGGVWRGLLLDPAELDAIPAEAALHLGLGAGCGVTAALARPDAVLDAWERDPLLLIEALRRQPWAEALREGRLRLHLGVDLLGLIGHPGPRWVHPRLASTLTLHIALLDGPPAGPIALLAEGELFVADLASALRHQGYRVLPWDILRCVPEELHEAAQRSGAVLVVAVNFTDGLVEATRRLGLPLLVWEIDPALTPPRAPVGPSDHCWIFTFRAANVTTYTQRRFAHVAHLPLAADVRRRRPLGEGPRQGLVFVGSSMVENGKRCRAAFAAALLRHQPHREKAAVAQKIEALLAAQRKQPMRWILPELVDEAFPGLRLAAGFPDPADLLGELAAAERRLLLVAQLGVLGAEVWGDAGWQAIAATGVRLRGYAAHGEALTRLYGEAAVNVDIGRLYQLDIVTMRVFDVLACGGFLLAERNEGLGALFTEGVHLEAWSSPAELLDKARFYLRRPALGAAMGAAGRAHVAAHHDIRQRLAQMMQTAGLIGPTGPAAP